MDRNWYSNLLTLIKTDLKASMKAQEYLIVKERFFQALELLDQSKIQVQEVRSGDLGLDPLFLGIIDMFEVLTKY
jgi:hypothetical protein